MPDPTTARLLTFVNRADVLGPDIEEACRRAGKELAEGTGEAIVAGRPYESGKALRQRIGDDGYQLLLDAAAEGWLDTAAEGSGEPAAGAGQDVEADAPAAPSQTREVADRADEDRRIRAGLEELLTRLKDIVEQKDWDGLAGIFPFSSIWVVDHPVPLSEVTAGLGRVLATAEDVEWQILRLVSADREADRGRLNLEVRLLWADRETWAEHHVRLTLHVGFEKEADTWKFTFCGLSPAAGEPAPEARPSEDYLGLKGSQDAYFESEYFAPAQRAAYFTEQAGAAGPYFGDAARAQAPYFESSYFEDSLQGYFGAPRAAAFGAPYFEEREVPYFEAAARAAAPPPSRPRRRSRYVMVYVPMLTPRDVVEDLLEKDEEA